MTEEQVELSRLATKTADLLELESRIDFVQAVMRSVSVQKVPQPYRGWMLDESSIPSDKRRVYPTTTPAPR
jgi:hypothetical protein